MFLFYQKSKKHNRLCFGISQKKELLNSEISKHLPQIITNIVYVLMCFAFNLQFCHLSLLPALSLLDQKLRRNWFINQKKKQKQLK